MPNEGKRIAELYHSVYEGDHTGEAWHGPALKPLLKDVSAERASMSPNPGLHSIAQLVSHIAYWEEIDLRRMNGEVVNPLLNTPEDWPSSRRLSDEEWRALLTRLEKSHAAMHNAMERCPDDKLNEKIPGRDHTIYLLLHGVVDHCVYHAAQIALVKKASAPHT